MKYKKESHLKNIPRKVVWCKRCLMSNQRPRIKFDRNDICSACNYHDYKKSINWKKRETEFLRLLDAHRSKKNDDWDVIVPSSGGKDSSFVAHELKYKYGMNPLLVTWSPLEYTDIGLKNYNRLIESGFSCIKADPNGIIHRKLARLCFEELGDAFHIFVLGQTYFPMHMALKFNIKLIFYGENGEVEYAGDPSSVDKPYNDVIKDLKWQKKYLKNSELNSLIKFGIKNKDYIKKTDFNSSELKFYNLPDIKEMRRKKISRFYFYNYFKNWNPQENYYYASENTGFLPNPERSEGTYSKYSSLDDKTDGMHFYMRYIKFGLGRCTEDVSHEIREGHLTRQEGLALVKKYENEFPEKYYQDFLRYLNISQTDFWKIVDSWRSSRLWKKKGNQWQLKFPAK